MSTLGVVLVVVGATLMVAEAHVPTHGAARHRRPPRRWPPGVVLRSRGRGRAGAAVVAAGLVTALAGLALAARDRAGKSLAARRRRRPRRADGAGRAVGTVRAVPAPIGQVLSTARCGARACGTSRRSAPVAEGGAGRRRARRRPHPHGPPGRGMGGALTMTAVLVVLVVLSRWRLSLRGASVRVLREYERAVVFRFGRLVGPEGPGPRAADADRRPHGARDAAHDHAHDPAAGRDHARQRARRASTPSPTSASSTRTRRSSTSRTTCGRPPRSRRPRCARCSARPSSTRCSPSASASTRTCSASSTSRPSRGGSRSSTVEIKDVGIPQACSARWRARPRPSASAARRSSTPRPSSRPPRGWPRRPT